MQASELPVALWRRRRTLIATFVVCFAGVVAVTLLLPKTYRATATLLVSGSQTPSDEVLRSFSALAGNPNTAEAVRRELPLRISRSELLDRMSFSPVEQTQLFEVTAEASSARAARTIANIYASVFTSRVGEDIARGDQTLSVSEQASLPSSPSKPDVPVYLGLGALLSLVAALGAALLRDRVHPRVSVGATDDSVLGQPIMARVPMLSTTGREQPLAVIDAFRVLKANLDHSSLEAPKTIVVTSPAALDGKTTVAAQLAMTYAAARDRVVLVEADLRRPGLASTVVGAGVEPAEKGLADYLAGAPLEDTIASHPEIVGLDVIWAGSSPTEDVGGLLGSPRMSALLKALRVTFDRVIVDTPPVSVGADASLLAAEADGTLVVIDLRSTSPGAARAGLAQLHKVRSRVLGVVVNHAAVNGLEAYYGAVARSA